MSRTVVLKPYCTTKSPGEFMERQIAGLHCQRFGFSSSRVEAKSEFLASPQVVLMELVQTSYMENIWGKTQEYPLYKLYPI